MFTVENLKTKRSHNIKIKTDAQSQHPEVIIVGIWLYYLY